VSDFDNIGWSIFIAAVTIAGLLGCLWLLFIASRGKVMAADNSTGHVWDENLKEMNNPLPLWWMVLFILTVLFAVAYLVLYPGLGNLAGTLGWTSRGEYTAEQDKSKAAMAPVYARFAAMPVEALAGDAGAMAISERLFLNNCSTCHGSDAKGSKGFPNLTDTDWIHGGGFEKIIETITLGRQGMMPAMAPAVGSAEDVRNLAHYVLSLSGSPHDSVSAQLGQGKFAVCSACHGPGGKGNQALGAPNLSDRVWLHGWGEETIVAMVNNGKSNAMPAQGSRLTAEQIRVLAAYVWRFSNSPKVASR
jgi:cytochrome c oxidase cbb3-type subunit 3